MLNFLVVYPAVAVDFLLVLAMAYRWFAVPLDRKRSEWMLAVSCLAIPANALAEGLALELSRLRPLKFDEFVYRIDALFGQPSFALGRLVAHHHALIILVSVSYSLLPIAIIGTFAAHLWLRSEDEALRVLWIFALNLFAAVPIYLLFPVCGPAFAFPGFPHAASVVVPHLLAIAAAPNGVPSVHTSSALLILWFLMPWRWGRVFGIIFLALTVLATLGSGQHYLFDLLCAIPYAVLVYRLAPTPAFFFRGVILAMGRVDSSR